MRRRMLDMLRDLCTNDFSGLFQQCIRCRSFLKPGMLISILKVCFRLGLNRQLRIGNLFRYDFFRLDDIAGFKDRIALLCFSQNVIEFIVSGQHDCVHIFVPSAFPIGQTQATAYHLLSQYFGCSGAERHDSIEVIDVPPLFEHVDVDDNFHRVFRIFHIKKQAGVGFGFRTLLLGMDDNGLVSISSAAKFIGLDKLLHPGRMVGVLADDQHKRFYKPLAVIGSVNLQLAFRVLMTGDAVQQHHFIELLIAKVVKINIGTGNRIRSTGIAILNRLGQRILIYHIFERNLLASLGHKGCGGQFQAQKRMQFVECLCALFCPIVVGFIHNEDQIR